MKQAIFQFIETLVAFIDLARHDRIPLLARLIEVTAGVLLAITFVPVPVFDATARLHALLATIVILSPIFVGWLLTVLDRRQ